MRLRNIHLPFSVIFWVIYFLYEWLGNSIANDDFRRYTINAIAIVPVSAAAGLFTVHVLIEKYFLKNKKRIFWIGLILSMFLFTLLRRCFSYYYNYTHYFPPWWQGSMPLIYAPKMIMEAANVYLIVGVYVMFYFIRAWYEQQRIAQLLQQDKLSGELELLKSQVHPHFIFNTLNNIYSLSLQKSDKAPAMIHSLSNFLSYNLYDSKMKTIPVKKELEYVFNYIELEKIRHGDKLDIAVNIYHPVDEFEIAPLLLLPLVENCFKHGIAAGSGKGWIRIDVTVQKDWLTVKIENSKPADKQTEKERNGIGLENVKRRLEILYPGQHEFKAIDDNQCYLVVLKIKKMGHEN